MIIRRADPAEPQATALLHASQALMRSLFPAEDNHFLDISALQAPHISFFVADRDGVLLGCCALADKGDYAEVKSMFVDPAARGAGAGAALLQAVETRACALGHTVLRLETGTGLDAAHRLYARFGFVPTGPFGDYHASPYSLFFEKRLGSSGQDQAPDQVPDQAPGV